MRRVLQALIISLFISGVLLGAVAVQQVSIGEVRALVPTQARDVLIDARMPLALHVTFLSSSRQPAADLEHTLRIDGWQRVHNDSVDRLVPMYIRSCCFGLVEEILTFQIYPQNRVEIWVTRHLRLPGKGGL